MKHQLIINNDTAFITSDEEIYQKDFVTNGVEVFSRNSMVEYSDEYANRYWQKIIAGIEGLPKINWNGIEEEFGYDKFLIKCNDLETQSFEGWSDDSISGYLTALITLKKQYQSLNEKKFSLEDMEGFIDYMYSHKTAHKYKDGYGDFQVFTNLMRQYTQSLQQPKVFDIEIGMVTINQDYRFKVGQVSQPKITNNSIKILKKL